MLKNMLVLMGILALTACSSAMPKKAPTQQEFYNPPTINLPKSQCVYKSAITEADKIQVHEQVKKLREAIYPNWIPPKTTKKDEVVYAYFDITPTCQITNIHVKGKDLILKQSVLSALQNTPLKDIEYKVFSTNKMTFRAK